MNNKENFKVFNIKCLIGANVIIDASVSIWTGKEDRPTVCQFPTSESYTYSGEVIMYYLEYIDSDGVIINTKSDRINNAFYELCSELEKLDIKMLIKGCSYTYYMIPRLYHTVNVVKLTLGERLVRGFPVVSVFSPELNIDKLRTPKQLVEYYYKWAESIVDVV